VDHVPSNILTPVRIPLLRKVTYLSDSRRLVTRDLGSGAWF
jgi:hypothetical protein